MAISLSIPVAGQIALTASADNSITYYSVSDVRYKNGFAGDGITPVVSLIDRNSGVNLGTYPYDQWQNAGTPFTSIASLISYLQTNNIAVATSGGGGGGVTTPAKTLTDASIASGTGNSVQVFPANTNGTGFQISNPSAASTAWVNPTGGTAAANGAGSVPLLPGGYYEDKITNALTVLVASGQPLTIKTY